VLTTGYLALIIIRLRRHRKNISGALTTTGSGMGPKKFVKMIMIAFSLMVIYLPIQIVWFTKNLPSGLTPYSWSRIHDPASWDPVVFFHTSDYPTLQYYGWASVAWNVAVFLFFGFNDEAIDIYRGWIVKLGLGKIWPRLKEPRLVRRPGSPSRTSLSSQFDIVGKAMRYFDSNARKHSQTTSSGGQGSES
jgi:pheromone a factor receptor